MNLFCCIFLLYFVSYTTTWLEVSKDQFFFYFKTMLSEVVVCKLHQLTQVADLVHNRVS